MTPDRRYVAYYRVSTPRQGRSGLGLEGQQLAVRQFLDANPGELVAGLTEIESGRKCARPQLAEALRLCRVYDAVLVLARLDRLARNVALIARLMERGAEFVVADFPGANRFTLHILAAVAEYESQLISSRITAACAAAKARGVKLGLQLKGSRVARPEDLMPARAAQLRRNTARAIALAPLLRELRDEGRSISGIAEELTRMEIEPPRGGERWYHASVRRLFRLSGEAPPARAQAGRRRPRRTDSCERRQARLPNSQALPTLAT